MEATNVITGRWEDAESRKRLEARLERAEAEVALCQSQLMAMSREHPSLRRLKA